MICDRCLARIAPQQSMLTTSTRSIRRTFAATAFRRAVPVSTNTASTTAAETHENKPAAASSSSAAGPARPPSAAPAGTVLRNINFMKGKQDPIALEDHEYPDWLWSALDKKKGDGDEAASEGDIFSKSKKQRRAAAKALRKRQLSNPDSLLPKVPLYEQTIDLSAGDGTLAGAKQALSERQDLTKAMRQHRRSKIKEANFLKAMG